MKTLYCDYLFLFLFDNITSHFIYIKDHFLAKNIKLKFGGE